MEPTESPDPTLSRAFWCVVGAGVVLSAVGFLGGGAALGLGALAGALVGTVNLAVLTRSVQRLLAGGGARYGAIVVLKFLGLIAVTYFLLGLVAVDPLGLALGFGALPLGIVVGAALWPSPLEPPTGSPPSPSSTPTLGSDSGLPSDSPLSGSALGSRN